MPAGSGAAVGAAVTSVAAHWNPLPVSWDAGPDCNTSDTEIGLNVGSESRAVNSKRAEWSTSVSPNHMVPAFDAHAPVSRANEAEAPVDPPRHAGPDVNAVSGAFAELVRSKLRPSHS